ncbi:RNA polymerase II subunit A C-terminal domain phosphatase-like [Pollicipes pollicipes]|uniref:RNA polymerase II subunit A C-terminal domain phosphatase-like n=1 Tax=Pollicipes pollicipes TaxID=41117 RepID=UPI001884F873|nr:RNA polymerase II subunit A C-terminal domain phosphatase-like [Pollicipes pollicipes]
MSINKVIKYSGSQPITIKRWKAKEGDFVSVGAILFTYVPAQEATNANRIADELKFKSDTFGNLEKITVKSGDVVHPGLEVAQMGACQHPVVMKDLCAECGADLRTEDNQGSASVAMLHSIPELRVSKEQAETIGKRDTELLLKHKKLVLLVDLDQTLIHTTNDEIPANIKDVYHFQLYGSNSPWYHTRFRPGTQTFLENISKYYELHICTFGARLYAHTIAGFLDPKGVYFSNRILSRDECFNQQSKRANLRALFPCGDNMVCIIDDREDVWNYAPNLIHVKPYHFFKHTGDINAPPGLEKAEQDEKEGFDFSTIQTAPEKEETETSCANAGAQRRDSMPNLTDDEDSDEKVLPQVSDTALTEGLTEDLSLSEDENEPSDDAPKTAVSEDPTAELVASDGPSSTKAATANDAEKAPEPARPEGTSAKPARPEGSSVEAGCESVRPGGSSVEAGCASVRPEGSSVEAGGEPVRPESSAVEAGGESARPEDMEAGGEPARAEGSSGEAGGGSARPQSSSGEAGGESPDGGGGRGTEKAAPSSAEGSSDCGESKPAVGACNSATSDESRAEGSQATKSEPTPVSEGCVNNGAVPEGKVSREIEVRDEDDYLLHLEDILLLIHRAFYSMLKKCDTREPPDLRLLIPYVRKKVLKGVRLVFSGVVPNNVELSTSRPYQVAVNLGAVVQEKLVRKGPRDELTTHLVAARLGTAKVNEALRSKRIQLVTLDWLWSCAERWERVEERLYPLRAETAVSRAPPAHCSSPDPEGERTRRQSFQETLNPLLTFSPDDIARMDEEVEDILQSGSDADDDDEAAGGSCARAAKRPAREDEDSSEDESPSVRFRRGEPLPSDDELGGDGNDSDGGPDLEEDWSMMGAELERELGGE